MVDMAAGDIQEPLTLMQAIDHLSDMAEIHPQSTWILGFAKPFIFEDFSEEILWHNPRIIIENKQYVKETFVTIHQWFKIFAETQSELLKTPEARRILKGIMDLAKEAMEGMDRYAVLFPSASESFEQLPEYHQLLKFYSHRIERGSQKKEVKKEEEEYSLQKYLFPDLESIRRDQHYEVLFLKTNTPLYSEKLLKHLHIVGNFHEFFLSQDEEQPFVRIREVLEVLTCQGAKEIIDRVMPHIDDFYKEAMHHKNRPYVANLNKALMALRLAANHKQQERDKTCIEYYNDFHLFLRLSMQAPGYRERILIEQEDPFSQVLLGLTHALCEGLFLRKDSFQEQMSLMHYFIQRGKSFTKNLRPQIDISKELQIWVEIVRSENAIRKLLKFFPSGPLMKAFMHLQEHSHAFDPLLQYLPGQIFTLIRKDIHVTVLHLACPTIQENLETCTLTEEFQGFLRYYQRKLESDTHLLFNLQNNTHAEDFARCNLLEKTAEQKEFSKTFFLMSLPKSGDFYEQKGRFEQMSGGPVFLETCLTHIFEEKDSGFVFPRIIHKEVFKHFAKKILDCIYLEFFQEKATLSQRERKDFIEFFYQLLILKCIEDIAPDSISFTCKDGADKGPVQNALFYAILVLLSGKELNFEMLIWLLFWPALSIRNRCLEPTCFHRGIECLFYVHSQIVTHPKAVEAIQNLFHHKMFSVGEDN